jgi:zinc and cadmium transporter
VTPLDRLALATTGIVLAALVGGATALWGRSSARRLEIFLAASAGLMLGVIATHMLPEAFEAGPAAASSVVAGFAFMLLVERFVLPHALHAPQSAEAHEHCDPAVEHQHVREDAAGMGAFLGLALHTLADGLALGAACHAPDGIVWVFLAIATHKVPSAFALGAILVRARARASRVLFSSLALGLMVGAGGLLFELLEKLASLEASQFTRYAIGFSAGSFLHVVVTDLLPDLHRRGGERRALLGAFIGGLGLILVLNRLFPD